CFLLLSLILVCVSVFFFQAEDGIRDRNVTGVQTCALPISCASCLLLSEVGELLSFADDGGAHVPLAVANRTAVIPQSPGLEHRLRPEVGDRCGKTVEMRDGDADA